MNRLCSSNRCLLPRRVHPNQTARSTSKSDYPIIQVSVTQSGAWDAKIAAIGDELQVRSRALPVQNR